jgi:hypothetical protein
MSKLHIILIIIIILLLLVIYKIYFIYTYIYYYEDTPYFKYKYTYLEDIINELDTGDLLLFSSYDFSKIRIVSHARFTHIAMVIKVENKIYGIDTIEKTFIKPNKLLSGINIFNLEEKIVYYPGFVYILKCNKLLSKQNKNDILLGIKNYKFKYPTSDIFIYKYIFNIQNSYTNKYKSCIEYIVYLLKRGNICNFDDIKIIDYMHHILLLCDDNIYTKPIRILIKNKNYIIDNYNRKNLC